jgi:Family of unknown function (DUF6090)
MINFLSKTRKQMADDNRPIKYMRYAIGEIVLVVIGILIALSINNWNTQRKEKNLEIKLYKNAILDLEQESKTDQTQIRWFKFFQDQHYMIYKQTKGDLPFDQEQKLNELIYSNFFRPLIQENYGKDVDMMGNEVIRMLFRDHIWREKLTMEATKEWNDMKYNELRPFFKKYGIYDTESIYNGKLYEFMSMDELPLINMEKLREQYGTVEFNQILWDLRFKASWVIHCLNNLEVANQHLNQALEYYMSGDLERLETIKPIESYY